MHKHRGKWIAGTAAMLLANGAEARDALGIFEGWGAFRDDRPLHCFAIAEPVKRQKSGRWRPFASVAHWPEAKVRGQLHIRLSAAKRRGTPVTLTVGDKPFALVAGGAEAWAADPRIDAGIVAAMRSAASMTVAFTDSGGRLRADAYRLRGAATAIDAAALGCAGRK